jgi:hypothetical protein
MDPALQSRAVVQAGHPSPSFYCYKNVDVRHKAGHDEPAGVLKASS